MFVFGSSPSPRPSPQGEGGHGHGSGLVVDCLVAPVMSILKEAKTSFEIEFAGVPEQHIRPLHGLKSDKSAHLLKNENHDMKLNGKSQSLLVGALLSASRL